MCPMPPVNTLLRVFENSLEHCYSHKQRDKKKKISIILWQIQELCLKLALFLNELSSCRI